MIGYNSTRLLSIGIILIMYVAICTGVWVNTLERVKRDDGSYAKDFGGPVAANPGPEEGDSNNAAVENPINHAQLPVQPTPIGPPKTNTALPPTKTIAAPPGSTSKCVFEQKSKQVLFVIANNARNRKRRDEHAAANPGPPEQNENLNEKPQEPSNHPDGKSPPSSGSVPATQAPSVLGPLLPPSEGFTFLNSTFCQTPEICFQKCQETKECNYFLRSFFNFITYMYKVSPEKITEGKYTDSLTYDSFIQKCVEAGGSVQPSNVSVIEDAKQKFQKKLNALNQKKSMNGSSSPLAESSQVELSYSTNATKNETKCISLVSDGDARKQFDIYLDTYNQKYGDEPLGAYGPPPPPKTYDSTEEKERRYQLFKDNLQIVQRLNCDRKGDEPAGFFEVTQFADQNYEEFISDSGGASDAVSLEELKPDLADKGAKLIAKCAKWNWVDQGVVPAPRKQGKCGSCYAFSTSDLIASQYHIDRKLKGQTFTLSPQYIVDCMKGPAALGCNGGRPIEVLRNFTKCDAPVGCNLPKEECYPYKGKKEKCKQEACQETPKIPVRFATINDLDGPKEKENVAALLNWGPAVTIIDADQSWQFYGGKGILRSSQCGKKQNHAVLVVGYDYTGSIPYYIIKNSWGTKWGDKGFIKLEAGKNTCSVAKTLTFCCTRNCNNFKDSTDFANRPNSEGCT